MVGYIALRLPTHLITQNRNPVGTNTYGRRKIHGLKGIDLKLRPPSNVVTGVWAVAQHGGSEFVFG